MFLAVVTGEITSTINHPFYDGKRLLVCDRIDPHGAPTGRYVVAVAGVDAGVGQRVLILDEGGSARIIVGDEAAPLRSMVIGIVDEVAVEASA